MKKIIYAFLLLFTCVLFTQCTSESETYQETTSALTSEKEKEPVLYEFDPIKEESKRLDQSLSDLIKGPLTCENLEVDIIMLQDEDENGCCRYIVNVYSSTGQDVEVFFDGQLIGSGPAIGHSYPIQVCAEAKTFEVFSNGVRCFVKTIKCAVKCCEEIEVIVDDFVDADGCCAYRVTYLDPNFCAPTSYNYQVVGDPHVDYQIVDGNVVATFTICNSGDTVELFILANPVPSTVCHYLLFGHNYCIP